jgi:hypothetical protein
MYLHLSRCSRSLFRAILMFRAPRLMSSRDIGMVQGRSCLGFALEPGERLRVSG